MARKVLLIFGITAIAVLILGTFVRASIEAGEERFWLLTFFGNVVPASALAVALGLNISIFMRALVFFVVVVLVVAAMFAVVSFADEINERPSAYRPFLPILAKSEALFLNVFQSESSEEERHRIKWAEWLSLSND